MYVESDDFTPPESICTQPGQPMALKFSEGPFLSHTDDGTSEVLVFTAEHRPSGGYPRSDFLVGYDAKTLSMKFVSPLPVDTDKTPPQIIAATAKHVVVNRGRWNIWSYRAADGKPVGSARTPQKPSGAACKHSDGVLIGVGELWEKEPDVLFNPETATISSPPGGLRMTSDECYPSCAADPKAAICLESAGYDVDEVLPSGVPQDQKKFWLGMNHRFWTRGRGAEFAVGHTSNPVQVPFALRLDRASMSIKWRVELPGPYDASARFDGPPDLIDNMLIVPYSRGGGRLVALSIENGSVRWEQPVPGGVPRILGRRVYGTNGLGNARVNTIPVLDLPTGAPVGTITAPTIDSPSKE